LRKEPVNKKQSIVLWVGALIIAAMAVCPPWKYLCGKYSIEKIGPYDFVFSPPEIPGKVSSDPLSFIRSGLRDLELEKEGLDFDKYPRDMWTVQVDWYRFILPVGAVGLLTITLTLTVRVQGSVKE
jgi:hypothetical protein